MGESRQVPFPTAQQVNLPACSPHCPFNAERQSGKLWIPILKSLVWPDSKSNPSLQLKRQTLHTTRPSEQKMFKFKLKKNWSNIINYLSQWSKTEKWAPGQMGTKTNGQWTNGYQDKWAPDKWEPGQISIRKNLHLKSFDSTVLHFPVCLWLLDKLHIQPHIYHIKSQACLNDLSLSSVCLHRNTKKRKDGKFARR